MPETFNKDGRCIGPTKLVEVAPLKSGCCAADVHYVPEHDNYYCTACRQGQGNEFYRAVKNQDAVKLVQRLQDEAVLMKNEILRLRACIKKNDVDSLLCILRDARNFIEQWNPGLPVERLVIGQALINRSTMLDRIDCELNARPIPSKKWPRDERTIPVPMSEVHQEVEKIGFHALKSDDRHDGRPSLLATIFFLMIAVSVAVVVGTVAKFWL